MSKEVDSLASGTREFELLTTGETIPALSRTASINSFKALFGRKS